MLCTKENGGLNLSNLKKYCWAAGTWKINTINNQWVKTIWNMVKCKKEIKTPGINILRNEDNNN